MADVKNIDGIVEMLAGAGIDVAAEAVGKLFPGAGVAVPMVKDLILGWFKNLSEADQQSAEGVTERDVFEALMSAKNVIPHDKFKV